MNTVCKITSTGRQVNILVEKWKSKLEEDINLIEDFFSEVDSLFSENHLALNWLKKEFEEISGLKELFDLRLGEQLQTHPAFEKWEVKDEGLEVSLFKGNVKLQQRLRSRFTQEAFSYCVVDTSTSSKSRKPIVQSKEDLVNNIAKFKQDLIVLIFNQLQLLTEVEEGKTRPLTNKDIVFNPEYGADSTAYSQVMSIAAEALKNFDIKKSNTLFNLFYPVFVLNNFDYLLESTLKGIIKVEPDKSGDLNRTEYQTNQAIDTTLQELQGIAEDNYDDATHHITPTTNFIIEAIPVVKPRFVYSGKKFYYSPNNESLDKIDVLQLSHWIQLNESKFIKVLGISENDLDLLDNPVHSIEIILSKIHEVINNYGLDTPTEISTFLQESGNTRPIQTALSLYEYLFNEKDRIDSNKRSISLINRSYYFGTPKFNIIENIIGQIISNDAPAFEEVGSNLLLQNTETKEDPIGKNFHQLFDSTKGEFLFADAIIDTVHTEINQEKSQIADTILEFTPPLKENTLVNKLLKFAQAILNPKYLQAIKQLLGIQESEDEVVQTLLLEADREMNREYRLYEAFIDVANVIKATDIKSLSAQDKTDAIHTAITLIANRLNPDVLGRTIGSLLGFTASSVYVTMEGNFQGNYRTQSLIFLQPLLIKGLRPSTSEELDGKTSGYIPLRNRTNFYINNPQVLLPGDNKAYKSLVVIPTRLGNELDSTESVKQPEFVQDLRYFVTDFISLMSTIKNGNYSPMFSFLLGTFADKSTTPGLLINAHQPIEQSNSEFAESLAETFFDKKTGLFDNEKLLNYVQAYQSAKTLDLTNHVIEDWIKVFFQVLRSEKSTNSKDKLNITKDASKRFIKILKATFGLRENASLNTINAIEQAVLQKLTITKLLFSDEAGSHSDLFSTFIRTLNKGLSSPFEELMVKVSELKEILIGPQGSVDFLNLLFSNEDFKSFFLEVVPQAATKRGVEIVENLHVYPYKEGLRFNQLIVFDLNKDCAVQEYAHIMDSNGNVRPISKIGYENYHMRMAQLALSKTYCIDGENGVKFAEYMIDFFTRNQEEFLKVFDSNNSLGHLGLFNGLFVKDSNGKIKLNTQKLGNIYFFYLTLSNFFTHQTLDLGVKEDYLDKSAESDTPKSQRSGAQQTMGKRNVAYTAGIKRFLPNLIKGISKDTKVCIIEDKKGFVFNTIGVNSKVDEYDGLGINSPYQARMESISLGHNHHISTKKTIIPAILGYSSMFFKWASNESTNAKIRESNGCEIDLEKIYKKMHDIKFEEDIDITKLWKNSKSELIDIKEFFGKDLYAREGGKFYKYLTIEKLSQDANGNPLTNTYIITRIEVDSNGKEFVDENGNPLREEEPIIKSIDSIYLIYKAFNGTNCMDISNGRLIYSESIHDFIFELICQVGTKLDSESTEISQTTIHQPLRDKFIGILATHSAVKRGASNITPSEAWTDESIPLSYSIINLSTGGEQLVAEHIADGSEITKSTLLIQVMAQKGYTPELVNNIYTALSQLMKNSSPEFRDIIMSINNLGEIQTKISKKIIKDLEGMADKATRNLIGRFLEEAERVDPEKSPILPLSYLLKETIKSYSVELNKKVIKQLDAGLMGTLNGADGFIQIYNLGGQIYTMGDFLDIENIYKFSPYFKTIEKYLSDNKDVSFEDIIRILSILDKNEDIEILTKFATKFPSSTFLKGEDPTISKLLISTLDLIRSKNEKNRKREAIDYFRANPSVTNFLGYERIPVKLVQPYQTVININTEDSILIDSSVKILDLYETSDGSVLVDKLVPMDLQPSITEVYTETTSENEYTSFESLLGARLNRMLNNTVNDTDYRIVTDLLSYLILFEPELQDILTKIQNNLPLTKEDFIKLREIQEDLLNFKNHIKSYGYTLSPYNGSFELYYSGLNPRKDFLQQVQSSIAKEDIIDKCLLSTEDRVITPKKRGNMTYSYGSDRRPGVTADSTFEAIKKGERTATTRHAKDGHLEYWSDLQVGDLVEFKDGKGESIFVEVTKPLTELTPNTDPEEWSKKEGWNVEHFTKKVLPNIRGVLNILPTEEQTEFIVEYTPQGKARLTYTVKIDNGNYHIFNKNGQEVFDFEGKDRTAIITNLEIQLGTAVIVEHKGNKYVVNKEGLIVSIQTKKVMKWGDENGDRKAILRLAYDKLNPNSQPYYEGRATRDKNTIVVTDSALEEGLTGDTYTLHTVNLSVSTNGITYNKLQQEAIEGVSEFIISNLSNSGSPQLITIQGAAGTGKTTIINEIIRLVNQKTGKRLNIEIAALAHKAKEVLSDKINKDVRANNRVSEHSISGALGMKETWYKNPDTGELVPIFTPDESIFISDRPLAQAQLVFIDEASMVNEELIELILETAKSGRTTTIVFIGDHAQLPPIRQSPYYKNKKVDANADSPVFTNQSTPKFVLTERVRQGEGNPILDVADRYRLFTDGKITTFPSNSDVTNNSNVLIGKLISIKSVVEAFEKAKELLDPNYVKVVAYHRHKVDAYNEAIHKLFVPEGLDIYIPQPGEPFTFYNNFQIDKNTIIPNSSDWMVINAEPVQEFKWGLLGYYVNLRSAKGQTIRVPVLYTSPENLLKHSQLETLFINEGNAGKKAGIYGAWDNYYELKALFADVKLGYAITAHKSQGSTYQISIVDVSDILSNRKTTLKQRSQAIYTAITRASDKIVLIDNSSQNAGITDSIIVPEKKKASVQSTSPTHQSVPKEKIIEGIKKLYDTARSMPEKLFKVDGLEDINQSRVSGYTELEMIDMFLEAGDIPSNIIFRKEWIETGKFNKPNVTVPVQESDPNSGQGSYQFEFRYIPNGITTKDEIPEDFIKAIKFYMKHQASPLKRESLDEILQDRTKFKEFLENHPEFIFKLYPYKRDLRYREFLESIGLDKITATYQSTALIIMPAIYGKLMGLEDMDFSKIDPSFFKKVPTRYRIPDSHLTLDDNGQIIQVDSDFVIRTFTSQYHIITTDDLVADDLDKYGEIILIKTDDQGYRIDPRTKKLIYKLPPKGLYQIRKSKQLNPRTNSYIWTETIILLNRPELDVYRNIAELIHSDKSIVSVEPFITNLINSKNLDKLWTLINYCSNLNIVPTFTDDHYPIYKIIKDFLLKQIQLLENTGIISENFESEFELVKKVLVREHFQAKDDYELKYRNSFYVSFVKSLDIIATRIPTLNMSSTMPMKVVARTKTDVNDVFVTKWQLWLLGADYLLVTRFTNATFLLKY